MNYKKNHKHTDQYIVEARNNHGLSHTFSVQATSKREAIQAAKLRMQGYGGYKIRDYSWSASKVSIF